MKLMPIKTYRGPEYPTQEILVQHPELLRVLPRRWQDSGRVLGTLAGLLALMEQSTTWAEDAPSLRVAPIFVHGEGQSWFGGTGGTMRVLLTEVEASEVIEVEAKKAGVEFAERNHKLNGVDLPTTNPYAFCEDIDKGQAIVSGAKPRSQKGDLKLNGWSAKLQFGYKVVTQEDFEAWEPEALKKRMDDPEACLPTAEKYDILDAAKRLQSGLERTKGKGMMVVFYDPVASAPENLKKPSELLPYDPSDQSLSKEKKRALMKADNKAWDDYKAAAKKVGEEQLRSQVKDFIAWLKAQGVI